MGGPTESIIAKSFYPIGLAGTGFFAVGFTNIYVKRPFFSGIQRHIAFTVAGFIAGYWYNGFLDRKWSKRDAVIRHYIELHPEDFKEERRQYKEVFSTWFPHR